MNDWAPGIITVDLDDKADLFSGYFSGVFAVDTSDQ
jgi:hypothetical protein